MQLRADDATEAVPRRAINSNEDRHKHLKAAVGFLYDKYSYSVALGKVKEQYKDCTLTPGTLSKRMTQWCTDNSIENGANYRLVFTRQRFIDSFEKAVLGRSDGLTPIQLQMAAVKFRLMATNLKDSPQKDAWHTLMCEACGRDPVSNPFSDQYVRDCAEEVGITYLVAGKANASRVQAVGDYRNQISCMAT
jgi:hypothetical protein